MNSSLAMGLEHSPALFQRIIDTVLGARMGKGADVYLDGIVIYGKLRKSMTKPLIGFFAIQRI